MISYKMQRREVQATGIVTSRTPKKFLLRLLFYSIPIQRRYYRRAFSRARSRPVTKRSIARSRCCSSIPMEITVRVIWFSLIERGANSYMCPPSGGGPHRDRTTSAWPTKTGTRGVGIGKEDEVSRAAADWIAPVDTCPHDETERRDHSVQECGIMYSVRDSDPRWPRLSCPVIYPVPVTILEICGCNKFEARIADLPGVRSRPSLGR